MSIGTHNVTKAFAPEKVFADRVFSELASTLLQAGIQSGFNNGQSSSVRVCAVRFVPSSIFRDISIHRDILGCVLLFGGRIYAGDAAYS